MSDVRRQELFEMKCGYCGLQSMPDDHICDNMTVNHLSVKKLRELVRAEIAMSQEIPGNFT